MAEVLRPVDQLPGVAVSTLPGATCPEIVGLVVLIGASVSRMYPLAGAMLTALTWLTPEPV